MTEMKLPFLGDNITQGTVTKILVKPGDTIKKGQNILELETDKAVLEVPADQNGVVRDILIKNGMNLKIGQPIFKIDATEASSTTAPSPSSKSATATSTLASTATTAKTTAPAPITGAIVDFNLPVLGENITKGTVTKLLVKTNDTVKKGQNILEIETDKAVVEVPSPVDFLLKEILIKSGAVVNVGSPIFKVVLGQATAAPTAIPSTPSTTKTSQTLPPTTSTTLTPNTPPTTSLPVRANVPAAPSVRLFAREIGIDIAQVPGSGPGGRISIDDIKKYAKALNTSRPAGGSSITAQPLPDFSKWGNIKREPMNNVRRKTAEHLSYAWSSIPHVTQFDKADITELEKLRKQISTPTNKISITPFIIKVLAAALKKFPQFNCAVDMTTSEIVYKDYINIGVAVDTDRGLIVPNIKNVDRMSIMQIHEALTALAQRARDRKTSMDEMQGGCFTLSNLGGIGGTFFTPIVNSPEVAILGVSRGVMEPVYTDGQFVPRLMLPVSLSYDHRVIDGADGARFIRWVCEAIQQPFLLDLNK